MILRKTIIINLVAFVAGGLLIFSFLRSSEKSNIKDLQEKNKILLLQNQRLSKSTDSLKDNIEKSTLVIESLNKKDDVLKQKVGLLNSKINSLKDEYEKANNHSNNFNTVDIQGYFSDLK